MASEIGTHHSRKHRYPAMNFRDLKRGLVCGTLAGALSVTAYYLIRRFPFTDSASFARSVAACAGLLILWSGCWALAVNFYHRWLSAPKKQQPIDAYTAALVEMDLERKKQARPSSTE